MTRLLHLTRVVRATVRFGLGSGRLAVVVAVVVGLALLAFVLTAKVVAPLAVYPFA